jgi:putative oxidoreductase
LELAGGLLLLLGLFTRQVAFVLGGFMAVAYLMTHASQCHLLVPLLQQRALAVLYCFLFLFFALAGPGTWSLDAMRRHRAETA